MRSGQPFNVAAIGGSVSKGHTLRDAREETCKFNLHRRIFDHLDAKFPGKGEPYIAKQSTESKKDEGRNGFINGAQGGTGSDYFSMCFQEHIPTDVDLVIVELAINDQNYPMFQKPFELLLRGLQDLPSQPAVIYVQVLALPLHALVSGAVPQTAIAQYMDVPTLSLQHAVLPQILRDEAFSQRVFATKNDGEIDARHISRWGHEKMGDLVSAYLDSQLCEMDRLEAAEKKRTGKASIDIDSLYALNPLPRVRFALLVCACTYTPQLLSSDTWDPTRVIPPLKPMCASMNSKNKPAPVKNDGWSEWAWKDKVSGVEGASRSTADGPELHGHQDTRCDHLVRDPHRPRPRAALLPPLVGVSPWCAQVLARRRRGRGRHDRGLLGPEVQHRAAVRRGQGRDPGQAHAQLQVLGQERQPRKRRRVPHHLHHEHLDTTI
ncbi:hypothetical protein VHUM_01204 [Vanrija humicola]|uniref:SGNH hydrolase-type esterase domain-containing protein n=1 Tax=Vanrija humicola TaxID=5417 RepID=A0A7D8V1C4_VANHU|nr:hypothetical protein VHUM_01204 [Vanrija humicola]